MLLYSLGVVAVSVESRVACSIHIHWKEWNEAGAFKMSAPYMLYSINFPTNGWSNPEFFWPKTNCTQRGIIPWNFRPLRSTISEELTTNNNNHTHKQTHWNPFAFEEGWLSFHIKAKAKDSFYFVKHLKILNFYLLKHFIKGNFSYLWYCHFWDNDSGR